MVAVIVGEEREESNLVGDVRSGFADITVHLAHDANVLVGVEQGVLVASTGAPVRGTICLQAGIGQDDYEAFGVFVVVRDRDVLLGDELGEFWRRAGLSPCSHV